MLSRRGLWIVRVLTFVAAFTAAGLAFPAEVQSFTPQGESKDVRQTLARFSEPMVAFGDPRLTDPFDVQCEGDAAKLKGRGRWADARNWVYDFESDLPGGQRCRFVLKPELKSLAGRPLQGRREFTFNTGGPAVVQSFPREEDDSIDEDQVFLLALDAPVDVSSLQNAWCEAAGIGERIPLKVLSQSETREILEANRSAAYNLFNVYVKGGPPVPFAKFRIEDKRWRDLPVIGVRCGRRLPAEAEVKLVVGPQVKTRTGVGRSTPQTLAFKVRPAFLVKLTCLRANKDAACLPVTPIEVQFTAPVPRDRAAALRLKSKDGKVSEPVVEPNVKTVESVKFTGPFDEKTQLTVELPKDLRDDAGREPANKSAFPLITATDQYPPLAKFPGRFGVLELNADPVLPLTVRNVESPLSGRQVEVTSATTNIPGRALRIAEDVEILKRQYGYARQEHLRAAEKALGRFPNEGEVRAIAANETATAFEVPTSGSRKELEVIGIPFKRPGFYIVELASPRLGRALHGEDKPYYVSTSVLVTNLAVHLKHGRESSLVWVTTLDRAKPVSGARVTVRDCTGHLWFEGRTDGSGIVQAGDKLPAPGSLPRCGHYRDVLVAFAQAGDDVSFTYSDWNEGIAPWNFNLRTAASRQRHLAIHTVFDRSLFRAGETVSMKHLARTPTGDGFRLPDTRELPRSLELEHVGSGQKYAVETRFDEQGIAETVWKIPPEAKLGSYRLSWGPAAESNATFRVEAFRVPLMRAVLAPPKAPLIKATEVKLDAAVSYLAGGPAANLPVKVRYRVEEWPAHFSEYSDFQFGGRPVKEGVTEGPLVDLWGTVDPDDENASGTPPTASSTTTRNLTLDASGTGKIVLDKLPPIDRPASMLVEMEYSDPNGEVLAVGRRVPLHPANVYVGIKPEGWAASRQAVRAQLVTLDPTGKPVAGRSVTVDVYERKSYSYRRRLVGGFYAYDTTTETKRLASSCSGITDERGFLFCTVKPRSSGEFILLARARDESGREATSNTSVWVRGEDDWWFEPTNNDRIDLVPEKKRYEPGETARFQVRMPFRQATVLVTVEREGVLAHQIVNVDATSPTIEVPIVGTYGPNVYVSALAVRGRVDPEVPGPYAWLKRLVYRVGYWLGLVDEVPVERDTRPTALVDLSKPAYKLGIAEIKVGERAYRLNVKVTPEREVLKVRDTVHVTIEATDADGKPAANGEIALAAVDEGLLELSDNPSWNVLEGMLGQRPIEVFTATAQGLVIGKRHFGRKAVAPGGGGGRTGARELFDTLLLWKARLPLDERGRASVAIPLNDSLTSFRIVAIANAGAAKFGDGSATIRTTQDLMLFSGLAPVVREQDEYSGLFTLRNATSQALDAKVAWAVRDRPPDDRAAKTLASGEQVVALKAGNAQTLALPMKAPIGVERLYWDIQSSTNGARDRLRTSQRVLEVTSVRVYQATLARLDKPLELSFDQPAGALPGRGGLRVDVIGMLGSDLPAVREYFARYPYTCLEQRASKAIALNDESSWQAVASSISNYLDADGLARYFPSDALAGSDTLTAYLIRIAADSGRDWPDAVRSRMLAGLEAFATGRIVRDSGLPTADLTLRKLAAIEALARHERARAAMLDSISIDPSLWPTSALIDWIGILKRVKDVPRRTERLAEALGLLRSRLNFQGTTVTFATERNDALWWLMISGDVNANRALLAVLDVPDWREDIGRLVRGTLGRQQRGRWNTTVANAWGTVALARFAETFEKVRASGTATITVGGTALPVKVEPGGETRDIAWPAARASVKIAHTGAGAPWAIVQSRAALPLKAPIASGFAIKRTITPVEQKEPSVYTRGDVYRVTLEIEAQSDMTWVVVDDPIPGGGLIVGSGLGRDAASLTRGEKRAGWAWPAFIERTQEAFRAYYELVPKGKFKVDYTVRLNNPGRFDLPATRVEALYAPEMFGEIPNSAIAVKP
jgi:uncharacterized protein YfaS (alpha-2-macroglobulin family)